MSIDEILEKFKAKLFNAEQLAFESCDLRDAAQNAAIIQAIADIKGIMKECVPGQPMCTCNIYGEETCYFHKPKIIDK